MPPGPAFGTLIIYRLLRNINTFLFSTHMPQAISGVTPAQEREAVVMTIFPSMAETSLGQALGQLYQNRAGIGSVFTLGNLAALATIPVALALYVFRLAPWNLTRYQLTNRRIVVQRGLTCQEDRAVALDRFDQIDVEVLPGQEWYPAGNLVFRHGQIETFRLTGVPRPNVFRQTCLKARQAFVGVRDALAQAS